MVIKKFLRSFLNRAFKMNKHPNQNESKIPGRLAVNLRPILIALLVDLTNLLFGHFIFVREKGNLTKVAENDLTTIAKLKVANISEWRKERLFRAELFYRNESFRQHRREIG
jgi:hypothetical protein